MNAATDISGRRLSRLNHCFFLRLLFACLASYSVLAVCSKSSFLYPMNDWVDVNCFFTVGRGILHDLVPYRDLYEQKGPLLYFVYALMAQISETSFFGVYLVEGLCFASFLHIGGRIAETLTDSNHIYWPAVALLALIVPITPAFSHGAGAEELILPVLAFCLWTVLKTVHLKLLLSRRQCFLLGVCAAAALWTKYTFCGIFLGMALVIMLWYLFCDQERQLFRVVGYLTLGFAALTAVVLGWYAIKGGLSSLWQVYFVNNLTLYSEEGWGGQFNAANLPWSGFAMYGMIWLSFYVYERRWEVTTVGLCAFCLFVFTYINGRQYPYYALIMAVFTPVGMAAAGATAKQIIRYLKPKTKTVIATFATVVLLLGGPWIAFLASQNTYLMKVKKEEMPQYQFAEIIRKSEDSSLLNYGFLDGGFYFANGVLPSDRYFCTLNIELPEMDETMIENIRQGKDAFIVTRQFQLKASKYQLVDKASMFLEDRVWNYYLYQREDLIND